jgi:hypothetical protein
MSTWLGVGIDRRIDLAWLEAAAGQVARRASDGEVRGYLTRFLDGVVSGDGPHSARGKTVTVLSHVWSAVPEGAQPLRALAIRLLGEAKPNERLAIHWAMVVGTYPFAADVAAVVGRVLALHQTAGMAQIIRKIAATWGERSTVARATQRLVRSMVEWGALRDGAVRGSFLGPAVKKPVSAEVGILLLEAVLLATRVDRMRLRQLESHPSLFPFALAVGVPHLRSATQLALTRSGLGEEDVWLTGSRINSAPSGRGRAS